MKRTLNGKCIAIALVLLFALFGALAFVACDAPDGTERGELSSVTLILGDGEAVSFETDAKYLYGALSDYCDDHGLVLEGEESEYGFFLTRVGDLVQDEGRYIMVYHDINDVALITPGHDRKRDGKVFHSSAQGVSSLPVMDGASYLIVLQ